MHDPLAVAVVSRPRAGDVASGARAVETAGEITRGRHRGGPADHRTAPGGELPIATAVDVAAFTDLFLDRLAGL